MVTCIKRHVCIHVHTTERIKGVLQGSMLRTLANAMLTLIIKLAGNRGNGFNCSEILEISIC